MIIDRIWEQLQEPELEGQFRGSIAYLCHERIMNRLDYTALYESKMHGIGHTERVILLGALIAMLIGLDEADTDLLLEACAYHDTGRCNDYVDPLHGRRSAINLEMLSDRTGDDLHLEQAMITLHSLPKSRQPEIFETFNVPDTEHTRRLCAALKDADGLDRVRLRDLDENKLRFEQSRKLTAFSEKLCAVYRSMEKQEQFAKRECRLFAMDLDDTLLDRKKTVPPRTASDVTAALHRGIETVFCTGRGMTELGSIMEKLPEVRYAVTDSGALVWDLQGKKILYQAGIGKEETRMILDTVRDRDCMIHLHLPQRSVVRRDQLHKMGLYHMGQYQEMFERVCDLTDDLEAYAGTVDRIPKINLYFRTPEERAEVREKLTGTGLSIAYAEEASLELSPEGVDKGTGLAALQRILGVTPEETASIGDAENDLEMFAHCAFNIAMGNAIAQVIEKADARTADQEHNGVGQALRLYLKAKKN